MTPEELLDSMHTCWPVFMRQEVVDPRQKNPRYRYSYKFNNKVALYLSPCFRSKYIKEHDKIKAKLQYRIPEYVNKPMELEIIITDANQVWREIITKLSPEIVGSWIDKLELETRNKAIAEKTARDISVKYNELVKDLPIRISTYPNINNPAEPCSQTNINFTDLTKQQILSLTDTIKQWCVDNHYREEDDFGQ